MYYLFNQICNLLKYSAPKPHGFVETKMESNLLALALQDADDRGQLGAIGIPKAWAALMFAIGWLIVYFPHDITWVPTSDWIIRPLCNIYADLSWGAKLIADKIGDILDHPDFDEDELRAIYAYLVEFIRWLRRLNFCFSIMLAHLRTINYWAYDTDLYNYEQCELTLARLVEYAYILGRRFDVNVVDGALG